MPRVIGIDIAKRTFDIATLQANGKYRTKPSWPTVQTASRSWSSGCSSTANRRPGS